jgi:aldose 1-epimerase
MQNKEHSHIKPICSTKLFGTLPDGLEVFEYTLRNQNGFEFSVINYGATITSLITPNKNQQKTDVVLGFDNLENYIQSFQLPSAPYLGAIVGRYAGRINKGKFTLNDTEIQLDTNNGNHHLHGGNSGFSRAFWNIKSIKMNENPSITLTYTSEDGEDNYPGKLTIEVTYTLTKNNELQVDYKAETTKTTVLNITQHSYFNLNGHTTALEQQQLIVHSDHILEVNPENIPTGQWLDVNTFKEFNYNVPKECPETIDNTFVLRDTKAASLKSELTGIKMNVITSFPGVHIYVGGNCFDKIEAKEAAKYHSKSGICFEAQNFPDAPNQAHFPTAILHPNTTYVHKTVFQFETF